LREQPYQGVPEEDRLALPLKRPQPVFVESLVSGPSLVYP
jgi:hypothetical protein